MMLTDILASKDVLFDLRASGKAQVLAELSRHAAHAVGVAPDLIAEALIRREKLGSTGMGDGIALPHARMPEVTAPFGILARLRTPIPFEAVDEKPVDLLFLLLMPIGEVGPQLNALACAARGLRHGSVLATLRSVRTKEELYRTFVAQGQAPQDRRVS